MSMTRTRTRDGLYVGWHEGCRADRLCVGFFDIVLGPVQTDLATYRLGYRGANHCRRQYPGPCANQYQAIVGLLQYRARGLSSHRCRSWWHDWYHSHSLLPALLHLHESGCVRHRLLLERVDNTGSNYSDLRGLWYRQPVLAGTLAIFLLALAGFPPMSGFAAKYYIFYAALQGGHPELLIIGVLASVLGMYYYLRVIATMFMEKEPVATVVPATNAPTTGNLTSGKRNSTKLSRDAMIAPGKGGYSRRCET